MPGRCLAGRYRLVELIGSGGAGTVWAAIDEVLERRVAVKDVGAPPWLSVEGWHELRERTLREARAAAAIGHPNVITVFDVVEEDGRPWIVMELVEARTLAQIIDEDGPCPPRRAAEIGLQVLAALRAAHRTGILHRDVKPSNVLVTADGRAVLTDFGIATVDGDATLTAAGVLVGAPAYIAPERAVGEPAGPASDLWSLGSTLYTAVEGRPPYSRDSAIDTISAVVHDDPDPTAKAGVLAPLLDRLLHRDPARRPCAAETERMLGFILSLAPDAASARRRTHPVAGARMIPTYIEPDTAQTDVAVPAGEHGASDRAYGQKPGPGRRHRVALLAVAATAVVMVLAIGFLARYSAVPGLPSHRPERPQPAEPVQVVDGPRPVVVPAAERPTGTVAPPTASTVPPVAPSTTAPPATTSAPEPTATEPSQPSTAPSTTEPPPPSTSGGAAPPGTGAAEPSVLP